MRMSSRFSRNWAYVAGAATVAVGVAHDAVVGTQLDAVKTLSQVDQNGFVWLFLCTGTAVAFSGILNLSAARGLARGESWARRLTLGSSVFLTVSGVSGLALGQWGASSLVALAVVSLVPWWATRRAAARPVPTVSTSREAGVA